MKNNLSNIRHVHRKDEHLSLALSYWKNHKENFNDFFVSFEDFRFIPQTFPEMSVADTKIETNILNNTFNTPFYIEAMTGGSEKSLQINADLAQIANEHDLAMAVGSQSVALTNLDAQASFKVVREKNPDGFVIANLGADHKIENAQIAVNLLSANAIEIHVNAAQELSMAEGDRTFRWLDNINELANKLSVPVIVKEVGFGMSTSAFNMLNELPIAAVNVSGVGGTNFAWIEQRRNSSKNINNDIDLNNFGFSTIESLLSAKKVEFSHSLIASGGISCPEDVLKSYILGAKHVGVAGYFLNVLVNNNKDTLGQVIENWKTALKKYLTLLGTDSLQNLSPDLLLPNQKVLSFIESLDDNNAFFSLYK